MGTFKIGDRVRFVEPYAKLEAGAEGTVTGFWSDGVDVNVNGRQHGCFYHRVELVTPALTLTPGKFYRTASGAVTGRVTKGDTGFEAVVDGHTKIFDSAGGAVHGGDDIVKEWAPKVGERVLFTEACDNNGWFFGPGTTVKDGIFAGSGDFGYKHEVSTTEGHSAYVNDCHIEPLPVASPSQPAATFQIEAGRYYKTRDGRKVGPMRANVGGLSGYPWEDESNWTMCWTDGWRYSIAASSDEDLIAEWVDEPASPPIAAQVDAIAEEYGPVVATKPTFKVGDRVKSIESGPTEGKVGTIIQDDESVVPYLVRFDNFDEGHGPQDRDWWLTAEGVEPAPANDNEPVKLVISVDTGTLHEELDELIAKLKKIKKLQRQVGLAA